MATALEAWPPRVLTMAGGAWGGQHLLTALVWSWLRAQQLV